MILQQILHKCKRFRKKFLTMKFFQEKRRVFRRLHMYLMFIQAKQNMPPTQHHHAKAPENSSILFKFYVDIGSYVSASTLYSLRIPYLRTFAGFLPLLDG